MYLCNVISERLSWGQVDAVLVPPPLTQSFFLRAGQVLLCHSPALLFLLSFPWAGL